VLTEIGSAAEELELFHPHIAGHEWLGEFPLSLLIFDKV
jgi:hypothetical protein